MKNSTRTHAAVRRNAIGCTLRAGRPGLARSLALASGLLVAMAAGAQAYQLVDLGPGVAPEDVNASQQVVGSMTQPDGSTTAFVYTPGGGLEGLAGTRAWAINDAGRIVGQTATGAFVLDSGEAPLEWADTGAFGVNESGVVSGNVALENPYRLEPRPLAPALYDGGDWRRLEIARVYPRGTRQGVYADLFVLWDVNAHGVAVGTKRRYGLVGSAALMTDAAFTRVDFLPLPDGGQAFAINDANQIVGVTAESTASGTPAHAFLYEADVVTDLGTLGGLRSSASDINEEGQVVGSSEIAVDTGSAQAPDASHAFLWDAVGGMVDLNGLVDVRGWVLTDAAAINEDGDIVGTGLRDGVPHGFLLVADGAVPPPPAGNQPPVASASADVVRGRAPLVVQFDAMASTDPEGLPLRYHWDFGDGTTSSDPSPTHTFDLKGTYFVVLTVIDEGGLGDSATLEITVRRARGSRR